MPQGKHSRLQTRLSATINQVGEPGKLDLATCPINYALPEIPM